MEVPLRGFRGLERSRAGKRQAWTPIKSHGCGLGMPVAKKDKFHTCGGPRRRPCLGEGRGRRISESIDPRAFLPVRGLILYVHRHAAFFEVRIDSKSGIVRRHSLKSVDFFQALSVDRLLPLWLVRIDLSLDII